MSSQVVTYGDIGAMGHDKLVGALSRKKKIRKVMHEFKEGSLHSGSKMGPRVKSRKQAIAIALSEAGMSKK